MDPTQTDVENIRPNVDLTPREDRSRVFRANFPQVPLQDLEETINIGAHPLKIPSIGSTSF